MRGRASPRMNIRRWHHFRFTCRITRNASVMSCRMGMPCRATITYGVAFKRQGCKCEGMTDTLWSSPPPRDNAAEYWRTETSQQPVAPGTGGSAGPWAMRSQHWVEVEGRRVDMRTNWFLQYMTADCPRFWSWVALVPLRQRR